MDCLQEVKIKAPAKINLGLEIIGKRSDGYHTIETFFQTIDLYDELHFFPEDAGIHLEVDNPALDTGDENLVHKAASLLLKYTNCPMGVKIKLKKGIPISAGLGGGSSDAAATLKGINRLYGLSVSKEVLLDIASSIGADCPFFINGTSAFGHGTGTTLEPSSPLPRFWVVLVKPGFSISTAWAYKKYDQRLTKRVNKIKILKSAINTSDPLKIGKALFNDLESVCFDHFPVLADIKRDLFSAGAIGALMSGSGPSMFGLFTDPGSAEEAMKCMTGSLKSVSGLYLCSTLLIGNP